jgi:hypothetical protein
MVEKILSPDGIVAHGMAYIEKRGAANLALRAGPRARRPGPRQRSGMRPDRAVLNGRGRAPGRMNGPISWDV